MNNNTNTFNTIILLINIVVLSLTIHSKLSRIEEKIDKLLTENKVESENDSVINSEMNRKFQNKMLENEE